MFSLSLYAEIARMAERAGVDFLFVADAPSLDPAPLGEHPGFSTLESHTLLSAVAALTRCIGLVPTVHTLFDAPYAAARRIQTLRAVAGDRVGWNAVTALGGIENFGGTADTNASEQRYERAEEFVSVVQALLASYPAEALRFERDTGRFAERDLVNAIAHVGEHFQIAGPLGTPAPPGTSSRHQPPVFQAGGSPRGIALAGAAADAVFITAPTVEQAAATRRALRASAQAQGRDPGSIRALPGLGMTLADTSEEAEQMRGHTAGAGHWRIVGTPEQAVQEIHGWLEDGAIDGFIALPEGSPRTIGLFLDRVLPKLSTSGFLRTR